MNPAVACSRNSTYLGSRGPYSVLTCCTVQLEMAIGPYARLGFGKLGILAERDILTGRTLKSIVFQVALKTVH